MVFTFTGYIVTSSLIDVNDVKALNRSELPNITLDTFLEELKPQKVLYLKIERYRRHGPIAGLIKEQPWTNSERYYENIWLEVDKEGNISLDTGFIIDNLGNMTQQIENNNGQLTFTDVGSGEKHIRYQNPVSVEDFLSAYVNNVYALISDYTIIKENTTGDSKSLLYEKVQDWDNTNYIDIGPDDIVIPWVLDLKPEKTISNVSYETDRPLFYHIQTFVVDKSGIKTLVEETNVIVVEILDTP